jgi:hypothetical protein
VSATNRGAVRKPLDSYYTDPEVASFLVGLLDIQPGQSCLEPHVGAGAFAHALLRRGAVVWAQDIDPAAPYIAEHGGHVGDFLTEQHPGYPDQHAWIVGNPPFTGFERHVDRALELAPRVAFLLRLAAMETAGRISCWKRWPLARVWALAERPSFTGGKTDNCAYGLFLFKRGFIGERAEVIPGVAWSSRPVKDPK